ncbi:MAG TPA: hypothetical protein VLJ11_09560 [Bryobacteraceae bacterium]|nr:hypothetical protein [Bryobacteraceae bacterium]
MLFFSLFSRHALPATALTCGQVVSGDISAAGQVDQYTYTAQAGAMITLTLANTGGFSGSSAYAQIIDPSGTVVKPYVAAGQQQVSLAAAGDYVIQVVGANFTATGTYNLGVQCLKSAAALTCGGIASGNISKAAQVDVYTYTGQAGGRITLTLADTDGFSKGSAYASVIDPSGKEVLPFFAAGLQQQVALTMTGTYVIQVVGADFTATGTYNLGLQCRNPLESAKSLTCGGLGSGDISKAAQVDQFTFAGQASGVITLTLANTGGFSGTSAYASLFDPDGNEVLHFFAAGQQEVTLAITGTYVVQVVGANFTATGTYNLGLQCISGFHGQGFVPVTPCRIADTRLGSGFSDPFGFPSLSAGSTRTFPIPFSSCGIPDTAQAYSLNVTVVPPGRLTYLSIWPTDEPQPVVSTLNSLDGRVVANAAIVPAGLNGAVDMYASEETNVIIDINGYFVSDISSTAAFYADTPCRLVDTRSGSGLTGDFGAPSLPFQAVRTFPLRSSSSCTVSKTATAYSLNATVVPNGPLTFLSLWPTGQAQPLVSTLNSLDGRVVANAAIVPAGTNGSIDTFASGNTDLILDTNGHFGPSGSAGALLFHPVTPCRVVDTRPGTGFSGPFGPPTLAAGSTRSFNIPANSCGIPTNAKAYALNVTVVPWGFLGYLTIWPTGATKPLVSTLNSYTGTVVANAALVPAGTSGAVSVFVTDKTDLIIDINGYFAP